MSLDAVGIVIRDAKKSVEFYALLGVTLKEVGDGHFEGTSGEIRIMLDSIDLMKEINPNWTEPAGSGIVLCFRQGSPEEVDELFSTITGAGYVGVKEPWDAFWGQRYCSVKDPDGNQIDIFSPL